MLLHEKESRLLPHGQMVVSIAGEGKRVAVPVGSKEIIDIISNYYDSTTGSLTNPNTPRTSSEDR